MEKKRWIALILAFALIVPSIPAYAKTGTAIVQAEEVALTEENQYDPIYFQEPREVYPQYSARANQAKQASLSLEEYVVSQLKKLPDEVDVSAYKIPADEKGTPFFQILNNHPELFYVQKSTSYSYREGYILSYKVRYQLPKEDIPRYQEELEAEVDLAVEQIDPSLSDLEKALALHDYLALHCEYDYDRFNSGTVPSISHTAYGALVNRMAVCDGYAGAFAYIMKDRFHVPCILVSSSQMAHAWNMISIGNQWYHVDVTWDDPVWDSVGRATHKYFMLSDSAMSDNEHKHMGWVSDYKATSAAYSSAFWTDVNSAIIYQQGAWHYSKYNAGTRKVNLVKKDSLLGSSEATVYAGDTWTIGSSYYPVSFMYLDQANGNIYFNTKNEIRRLGSDGKTTVVYQPAMPANQWIYGFSIQGNQLRYALQDSPVNDSKQDVKSHVLPELEPVVLPELTGVSADNVQAVYDGTAKSIAIKGVQAGDVITYALAGGVYSQSQPQMVDAGTYQVSYRVERSGYKPFTGTADVTIEQAVPSYTAPSGLKGDSGKTLGSIALPEGFSWQTAASTRLSKEGTYTYLVKYVPKDTKNYKQVAGIQVQVTVSCPGHQYQAEVTKEPTTAETGLRTYTCALCGHTYTEEIEKLPMPALTGIKAENVQAVYDGKAKAITITGLQNGDVVTYALAGGAYRQSQPEMKDAGTYQVSYRVERSGYQRFEGSALVEIAQAVPSFLVPEGLQGNSGKDLASVALPEGFAWQTAEDTKLSAEGTFSYLVRYVPKDSKNYKEVSDIQVQVEVSCPGHLYSSEVTKEPTTAETGIKTFTCAICGNQYTEVLDKLTMPAITGVKAENVQAVYDGKAKTITVTGLQNGDAVTYALADGTFGASQPEMKDAGIYQVSYRVERSGYERFEGSAIVAIEQAVPSYTAPKGLKGNIGEKLASIALPEGFAWQTDAGTALSEAGTAQYLVKYVPKDTKNYKEVGNIQVEVEVSCPGHQYTVTITKEPTTTEKGERLYTCKICGNAYTEEIEIRDPSLPQIEGIHAKDVRKTYDGRPAAISLEGLAEGDYVLYLGEDGKFGDTLPEIVDAGEYQISYRVERKGFQPLEGSVEISIEQAQPIYDVPTGLEGIVGEILGSVELPEGFRWQSNAGQQLAKEGTFQYLVKYVPEDTHNYKEVSDIQVKVAVSCPGHAYRSAVTQKPTTMQKGVRTYTCSICGDTYTEEIAKLAPQKPGNVSGQKVSKATASSLKFTWKKASGVRYELALSQGKKKVSTKDAGSNSVTFSKLKAGTEYSLKITPYREADGRKIYAAKSATVKAATAPAQVKLSSVKKSGSKKAKVTWKKTAGASGYEVYMRTGNGKYKKVKALASGKKVSHIQSGLKKGKTYGFRVRAYKKVGSTKVYGSFSSVKSIKIR